MLQSAARVMASKRTLLASKVSLHMIFPIIYHFLARICLAEGDWNH